MDIGALVTLICKQMVQLEICGASPKMIRDAQFLLHRSRLLSRSSRMQWLRTAELIELLVSIERQITEIAENGQQRMSSSAASGNLETKLGKCRYLVEEMLKQNLIAQVAIVEFAAFSLSPTMHAGTCFVI